MIRKTMRVGEERQTSIMLEAEFWSYLEVVAEGRGMRLSALVREVAAAAPGGASLASTLRVFALTHAWRAATERRAAGPGPERSLAPPGPRGPGGSGPRARGTTRRRGAPE
jgi:predicted DNA-binding ribbon-helix-helix protein